MLCDYYPNNMAPRGWVDPKPAPLMRYVCVHMLTDGRRAHPHAIYMQDQQAFWERLQIWRQEADVVTG